MSSALNESVSAQTSQLSARGLLGGESGSAAPHQSSRLPTLSVSCTVTLDKLVNPSLRQLFHLYSGLKSLFDSEVQ